MGEHISIWSERAARKLGSIEVDVGAFDDDDPIQMKEEIQWARQIRIMVH